MGAVPRRYGPPAPGPVILTLCAATFSDPVRRAAAVLPVIESETGLLSTENDPLYIIRVGIAMVYVDRIEECREALFRVVEDGRDGGAIAASINAIITLSVDDWLTGRWDEAEELIAEGIELCRRHGYQRYSWILAGYIRSLISTARGLVNGYAAAEEMTQWATPRGALVGRAFGHHIRCIAALGRSDFEVAFQNAAAVSPPGTLTSHVPHALWLVLDLVESAVRTGRDTEAQAHVVALQEAGLAGLTPRLALVATAAAALVADGDEARALFEQAIATPEADHWPFELARVHLLFGEMLRRARAITAARRHLTAALTIFEQLQAAPWQTRTVNELRATGLTGAEASDPRPSTLTPQEYEIAALAATGMTNKEIGERLALSHRTVAAHLYRAFPKLGIGSRAGLRDALPERRPG